MKTKIIYISGNELFDMSDIRAAFEEVRTALSLDKETILFGVPVDNDDAFVGTDNTDTVEKHIENIIEPIVDDSPIPVDVATNIVENNVSDISQPSTEKTKKSTRHSRAKVVPIAPVDDTPQTLHAESDNEPKEETPIPILSVLGAKSESEQEAIVSDEKPIVITPIDTEPIADDTSIEPVTESDETVINPDTQSVSINDMLAEDSAPVDVHEKTLEELLESMTPLGEDEKIAEPVTSDSIEETKTEVAQTQDDDTDATLELLATEFAAAEDKIVTPSKTDSRGKIGKLKNILPFKKAKRDDSGLMGDLFGWAGVANDEDFTIPGFFANASSKK